ncbi:MAG: restriction endonuclease subunit S [Kiritimatiellae bacterium]|nr:restriction endonuclease subunit S [Kiritimatiellia bacterium]
MKSAKFKDSSLGPIPQDWEVKRLGEIGEPLMCKRVLKHQTSDQGDIPFYKIGTFGKTPDAYITRSLFESLRSKYPFPRKGDCLISAAGTIGRVVVYNGEDAYFQDSNIVWIDNDEAVVTNEYLALCYALMKWQSEDGGIISRLYNANLKAQIIVCPPLPEQQRIAESLGEVDKLIESLDEQIEKKRLIAKGVAHDLLSAKKRLPGFKGEWRCANLGTLVDFITDTIATKDIDTRKYVSTDNMLSNLAGVTPNKSIVPYASVREFKSGDILLSNIRPYLKKMWFADYDAGCSTDVLVLRVVADLIDSRFLYRVLARDTFFEFVSAKAVGTKMPRGDKRVIAVFQVPIPQLAEQQAIADLLGEQDAAIAALVEKREKYVRIKEGMMRDLLTGKVRMKGELTKKEACA